MSTPHEHQHSAWAYAKGARDAECRSAWREYSRQYKKAHRDKLRGGLVPKHLIVWVRPDAEVPEMIS